MIQLLGSGSILREVIAAADILTEDFGFDSDVWSVTSFTELRREAMAVNRANRMKPEGKGQMPYVTGLLKDRSGPVVAATDYVRAHADQIRAFVPQRDYLVLGTDGFGRSDTRENLRRFFEVDRNYVVYTALTGLYQREQISKDELLKARDKLGIDPDKPLPASV